jgi:hypothetical protein
LRIGSVKVWDLEAQTRTAREFDSFDKTPTGKFAEVYEKGEIHLPPSSFAEVYFKEKIRFHITI